jgi:hypothetical protein
MDIMKIVEQFSRDPEALSGEIKVTRVPDFKTMHIETINEIGRSIIFKEYKVDGKTYWAGYSLRSETVFVSQTGIGS